MLPMPGVVGRQAMRAGQAGPHGVVQQPTGVADAARLAAMRAAQQSAVAGGQAQVSLLLKSLQDGEKHQMPSLARLALSECRLSAMSM